MPRSRPSSTVGDATSEELLESILVTLRERGGRVTTARRTLLRVLLDENGHRTAEEIAQEVHALTPDVNLSTIYRNLEEFERLGVVSHAHLGHGAATYHLSSDRHGHLVCESCGFTVEAPADFFETLAAKSAKQFGFTIDFRHFAVLGRCQHCPSRPD
jgi:Fur family transcriptional regulator, ferric uptake regulator